MIAVLGETNNSDAFITIGFHFLRVEPRCKYVCNTMTFLFLPAFNRCLIFFLLQVVHLSAHSDMNLFVWVITRIYLCACASQLHVMLFLPFPRSSLSR